MTEQPSSPPPSWPEELSRFTARIPGNRYPDQALKLERRFPGSTATPAEEPTFASPMPRPSHWSIAWSDLMMTMFILFLSMFVYQTAQQEFLGEPTPEIIGGDTSEALQTLDSSGAAFPFAPISPGLPLISGGKIPKVAPLPIPSAKDQDAETSTAVPDNTPSGGEEKEGSAGTPRESVQVAIVVKESDERPPQLQADLLPPPEGDILEPRPLLSTPPTPVAGEDFVEMFALGRDALESGNLEKFAAIDIVPDKTMRIILTSDLLFALGENHLSQDARQSLRQVAAVIRQTPYMINVVGHTDNVPMRSNRFDSNWELSVTRASTVTRFLIDETGMDPMQFVVSGYSSYRPLFPNTTADNRARNRRVEIIISKRLPNPVPATTDNLN